MKIIQSILTKNDCYKAGRKITVRGLMLHSVGCPQPNASVFVRNWNKAGLKKCVHAFIDGNTGDVHQTLPWNHRAWHCGDDGNNTHIGVELCEPACIKYKPNSNIFTCSNLPLARAVVQRTYDTAVALFAHLCTTYGLDPLKDGVIISHKEGAKRGIASNHGDPEHLWNQLGMGYTMDTFRKAVKAAMTVGGVITPGTAENATQGGYKVKITASVLNVRKGAGIGYGIATTVKKNEVYTIVDESNGWGKLKSGAGWISLKYTIKL